MPSIVATISIASKTDSTITFTVDANVKGEPGKDLKAPYSAWVANDLYDEGDNLIFREFHSVDWGDDGPDIGQSGPYTLIVDDVPADHGTAYVWVFPAIDAVSRTVEYSV